MGLELLGVFVVVCSINEFNYPLQLLRIFTEFIYSQNITNVYFYFKLKMNNSRDYLLISDEDRDNRIEFLLSGELPNNLKGKDFINMKEDNQKFIFSHL